MPVAGSYGEGMIMAILVLGILAGLGLVVAAMHAFLCLPIWLAILIIVLLCVIVASLV